MCIVGCMLVHSGMLDSFQGFRVFRVAIESFCNWEVTKSREYSDVDLGLKCRRLAGVG